MIKFIKKEWFKLSILILIIVALYIVHDFLKIDDTKSLLVEEALVVNTEVEDLDNLSKEMASVEFIEEVEVPALTEELQEEETPQVETFLKPTPQNTELAENYLARDKERMDRLFAELEQVVVIGNLILDALNRRYEITIEYKKNIQEASKSIETIELSNAIYGSLQSIDLNIQHLKEERAQISKDLENIENTLLWTRAQSEYLENTVFVSSSEYIKTTETYNGAAKNAADYNYIFDELMETEEYLAGLSDEIYAESYADILDFAYVVYKNSNQLTKDEYEELREEIKPPVCIIKRVNILNGLSCNV